MTKAPSALSFYSHSTNMKKSRQYICIHKQVHLPEIYTILLIWVKRKFGHCLGSPLEFEMHSWFADVTQVFCLALDKSPKLSFQITSSVSSKPSLSSSVQTLSPSTSSLSELTSLSVMPIQLFIQLCFTKALWKYVLLFPCWSFHFQNLESCINLVWRLVTWTGTTEGCQFLVGDCNNVQHGV